MDEVQRFVHLCLLASPEELGLLRRRHALYLGKKVLKMLASPKNISEAEIAVSLDGNEIKLDSPGLNISACLGEDHFFYCLDGVEWIPCNYRTLAKKGITGTAGVMYGELEQPASA